MKLLDESRVSEIPNNTYCRALGWVNFGGRREPVLPWVAIKYFLVLLLCLLAISGIIEFRLTQLAKQGVVVSDVWKSENDAINKMNYAKIKSDDSDPVWQSEGIPPPGPKNGRARILVVGDSFVWSDGYANINDTWWRQLERELRQRGYQDVDVVAAGLNGASTQDHLRWFKDLKLLEKIEPDIVILGYVTNDPDVKDFFGQSYVKRSDSDLIVDGLRGILKRTLGLFAPNLTTQLNDHLARKVESKGDGYSYQEWELKILEPPSIDAYKEIVRELGQFVQSKNIPFFVVTLPNNPSKAFFDKRYDPIIPIFESAGLQFFNLLDDFIQEHPNNDGASELKWGINPANGHPGTVSTRFYARKVGNILEKDFAQLLGPKTAHHVTAPAINDWLPPSGRVRQINSQEWELSYPEKDAATPMLPIGKPHMIMSFSEPAPILQVKISGAKLIKSELYLTKVDPATGIETKETVTLGSKSGKETVWSPNDAARWGDVNTLKLAAKFDDSASTPEDRKLNIQIDFYKDQEGHE